MLTSNVLKRIFFIRDSRYGTAFTIDVDGREYLVSARHLFESPQETKSVKLMHEKQWIDWPVTLAGVGRGELDIVVFETNKPLTLGHLPLPVGDSGLIFGQDVYFAGYPYKMWTDLGTALGGWPAPFIRKGTISSAFDMSDGVHRIYVDAINNEGFSGAPLLFSIVGERIEYRVMGVVSGFKTAYEPVLDEHGEPTVMTVAYNTGFLLAYGINHVVRLIEAYRKNSP